MTRERDHIGFDPAAWVERLLEVNRGSQFEPGAKDIIKAYLCNLRNELKANGF